MNNPDTSKPIFIILTIFRRLDLHEVHLCINKVHEAQGNSPFWNHEGHILCYCLCKSLDRGHVCNLQYTQLDKSKVAFIQYTLVATLETFIAKQTMNNPDTSKPVSQIYPMHEYFCILNYALQQILKLS